MQFENDLWTFSEQWRPGWYFEAICSLSADTKSWICLRRIVDPHSAHGKNGEGSNRDRISGSGLSPNRSVAAPDKPRNNKLSWAQHDRHLTRFHCWYSIMIKTRIQWPINKLQCVRKICIIQQHLKPIALRNQKKNITRHEWIISRHIENPCWSAIKWKKKAPIPRDFSDRSCLFLRDVIGKHWIGDPKGNCESFSRVFGLRFP
jgi:hypothetical protein